MKPNHLIVTVLFVLFVVVIPSEVLAIKENSDFMYCINQIKQMKSCMYDYSLQVRFDDGTTETVRGQSYFDITHQYVYNSNSVATILYDGKWYYHADHEEKKVTIYRMDKRFRPGVADSMRKEIFQMGIYNDMMDSLVLKYGRTPAVIKSNNKVKFDILFIPNSYIKRISIEFDMKTNMLVKCEVEAYFSIENYGNESHKAIQTMSCTNYKRTPDTDVARLDNYFSVAANEKHIKLLKYKNYKLITTK